MKQSVDLLSLSFQASGAVGRGRAIGFDGAQATVAAQAVMGVSRASFATGEWGDVVVIGTAVVELGGIVNKGSRVVTDTQGRAIAYNPQAWSASEHPFGRALESGVAGDFIEVVLSR